MRFLPYLNMCVLMGMCAAIPIGGVLGGIVAWMTWRPGG